MAAHKVILTTGRTFKQGEAIEKGKDTELYKDATAICELDSADMKKLKVKEGDTVTITTEAGEVNVRAASSNQGPHPGIIFMPMGLWANVLTPAGTDSTGMPPYKRIEAEIRPAKGKKVLDSNELLERLYPKEAGHGN